MYPAVDIQLPPVARTGRPGPTIWPGHRWCRRLPGKRPAYQLTRRFTPPGGVGRGRGDRSGRALEPDRSPARTPGGERVPPCPLPRGARTVRLRPGRPRWAGRV